MVVPGNIAKYIGRKLSDVQDELLAAAKQQGFTVNIMDPIINTFNIDDEYRRLNVRISTIGIIRAMDVG